MSDMTPHSTKGLFTLCKHIVDQTITYQLSRPPTPLVYSAINCWEEIVLRARNLTDYEFERYLLLYKISKTSGAWQ